MKSKNAANAKESETITNGKGQFYLTINKCLFNETLGVFLTENLNEENSLLNLHHSLAISII